MFSCQRGLAEWSASQSVCWILLHLSGVCGDTSPSWGGVTCEPLLPCPLLQAGLVLAGVGGSRGLWEKAQLRVSFLAWPNIFLSSAECLRAGWPHPTHSSWGGAEGVLFLAVHIPLQHAKLFLMQNVLSASARRFSILLDPRYIYKVGPMTLKASTFFNFAFYQDL